ncbi:MAG: DUF4296 domain-containing protein [Bacteroidota bacterium]
MKLDNYRWSYVSNFNWQINIWAARLGCFLVLALGSCAQAGPGSPPAEVQDLVPVLADLHLLEAMIDELPLALRDSTRQIWYDNTLADHNMTFAEFDSLTWVLRSEPEWLTEVYTKVGEELAVREALE